MDKGRKWYSRPGRENDVILSSRVVLARNLAGIPFPERASPEQKQQVAFQVKEALLPRSAGMGQPFEWIVLSELSGTAAIALAEGGLMPPETVADPAGKALLVSGDEEISVLVNEGDHLQIQILLPGEALPQAAELADRLESLLGESLSFAFDPEWGYLTQLPEDLGTALQGSVLLHLPALEEGGALERIGANYEKLGFSLTQSTPGVGSFGAQYRLANRLTLGLEEKEAIGNLETIALKLAGEERNARRELREDLVLRDRIDRAFGVLQHARLLPAEEWAQLLSLVRLGVSLGHLQGITPELLLTLEHETRAAALSLQMESPPTPEEIPFYRAERVRELLASGGLEEK